MIPGIDISHWQQEIDWGEVRRSGVEFAYIQATEYARRSTELTTSPKLLFHMREAGLNGLHWGAYHLFAAHIDPLTQAQAYLAAVGEFQSLPPAVKLEQPGLKAERMNYKVRQFLDEIENDTGRKALIHTTRAFWSHCICAEDPTHADWARDYPLWIAQADDMWPGPMYPWAGWTLWSFTDSGRLPGIRTDVRMMWYRGSGQEMADEWLLNARAAYRADDDPENNAPLVFNTDEISGTPLIDTSENLYSGDFQEKMGGKEEFEVEYASATPTGAESSQPKDSSWIDTYLFQH